jgi:hypothetical protein
MTDHELEQALRALLRADVDQHEGAPAQLRAQLPALLAAGAGTQPGRLAGGWTAPSMLRFAPLALAIAAVVALALLGIGLVVRAPEVGPPVTSQSPSAEASPAESARVYGGWPTTTQNPPGVYSWDGSSCVRRPSASCNVGLIHNGYGANNVTITIRSVDAGEIGDGGTPATVAGHEGIYRRDDDLTERWFVEIEGTTIAIAVSVDPGTRQVYLDEAHAIVDSMRTEPWDNSLGFRLLFTLTTDDWDSG